MDENIGALTYVDPSFNQKSSSINTWNIIIVFLIVLLGALGFFIVTSFTPSRPTFIAGKTYAGNWKTTNIPDIPAQLTILAINNNEAKINYTWGTDFDGYTFGYTVSNAIINQKDKSITWGGNDTSSQFVFHLKNNGTLEGKRRVNNTKSTIVMASVTSPTPLPTFSKFSPTTACTLNTKFNPLSEQRIPFSSMLRDSPVSPEIANYVGAYEGKVGNDMVRLIIFPTGILQFVTEPMTKREVENSRRNGIFFAGQLSWFSVLGSKTTFSYNARRTDNGIALHVVKYVLGKEFDTLLTPCSVNENS